MKIKITLHRHKCISAATCVVLAPNTFELDSKSLVVLKNKNGDSTDKIIEAAKSCPTMAIEIEDYDTGKKIWPK